MSLLDNLKGNLEDYTSAPFWSWNSDLSEVELLNQLKDLKSQGIDSAIMHARTGLVTKYLSEDWFSLVNACLKKAKELNMRLWVYDENGWPSGFAEGRLLKENYYAQYLNYEVKNYFDKSADVVYSVSDGVIKRLKQNEVAKEYHCIYILENKNYADILNPDLTDAFINATHEEYYARFSEHFGNELIGFFTDEPQYFRYATPFSIILPENFNKEYNEDIYDGLVYLFLNNEQGYDFRYKYFLLLNKMYTNNFYKRIYDWCDKHNCLLTGHTVEEVKIAYQMWCCAGAMPSYMYQHVPGIDWLGRDLDSCLSPKQVSSVAQQFGRKQVLTETFGCSGWDANPRELRRITEFQYVNGVNSMCQHLYSYSIRGEGKNDHPPSFSTHNPWIKDSLDFNNYFKRLSYLLQNTDECSNILVIHPMHSAYLTYIRSIDYGSTKHLEEPFIRLLELLQQKGLQFNLGDESVLKICGSVSGEKLVVGKKTYNYLIIPEMDSIDSSTYYLIKEYQEAGGKILALAKPTFINGIKANVEIVSNFKLEDLKPKYNILFENNDNSITISHRKNKDYELLYIVNHDLSRLKTIKNCNDYFLLDLNSNKLMSIEDNIVIQPSESVILIKSKELFSNDTYKNPKNSIDITKEFKYISSSENCLTVDYVSISFDGKTFAEAEYIYSINERLIKSEYNGELYIKYSFNSLTDLKDAKILLEDLNYKSAKLNGKDITFEKSEFDVFFIEAKSLNVLKGENNLILKLNYFQKETVKKVLYGDESQESLKNCLCIDTVIASIYVLGKFSVDSNRNISQIKSVQGLDNLQNKGFPNFSGSVKFSAKLTYNEHNKAFLKLSGRYMIAKISVNNKEVQKAILSPVVELSDYLKNGNNEVTIELVSSLRNMLGPHHYIDGETPSIWPFVYNMFGTWENGKSHAYNEKYNLVNFGLEKIELLV